MREGNNHPGFLFVPDKKGQRKDYLYLKERRVTSGLTQQQVADKAGIKLQQYQKFESGERNLRAASFQLACRVLEALELDITRYYHGGYDLQKTLEVQKGKRRNGRGEEIDQIVKECAALGDETSA